jgi:hypothetical protein
VHFGYGDCQKDDQTEADQFVEGEDRHIVRLAGIVQPEAGGEYDEE